MLDIDREKMHCLVCSYKPQLAQESYQPYHQRKNLLGVKGKTRGSMVYIKGKLTQKGMGRTCSSAMGLPSPWGKVTHLSEM